MYHDRLILQGSCSRGDREPVFRFRKGQPVAAGIRKIIVDGVILIGQNNLIQPGRRVINHLMLRGLGLLLGRKARDHTMVLHTGDDGVVPADIGSSERSRAVVGVAQIQHEVVKTTVASGKRGDSVSVQQAAAGWASSWESHPSEDLSEPSHKLVSTAGALHDPALFTRFHKPVIHPQGDAALGAEIRQDRLGFRDRRVPSISMLCNSWHTKTHGERRKSHYHR